MMTAIRKGIRINIDSLGDLVEERVRFYEIIAEVMTNGLKA
jgi:hypothetical protein